MSNRIFPQLGEIQWLVQGWSHDVVDGGINAEWVQEATQVLTKMSFSIVYIRAVRTIITIQLTKNNNQETCVSIVEISQLNRLDQYEWTDNLDN